MAQPPRVSTHNEKCEKCPPKVLKQGFWLVCKIVLIAMKNDMS